MARVKTPRIPTFEDALENWWTSRAYRLYCHLPGQVVTFDRATLTITASVGLKQVIPDVSVPTGQRLAPYPQLTHVPVFTLQGSGGSVGADPAPGDTCLLAIADRNIDAWFQNGGQQAPLSPRCHDLSDAFAFVGFNPLVKIPVSARLAGETGIADAVAKMVVKNGKASISNGPLSTQKLGPILSDLFATLASDPGLSAGSHTALTNAAAQVSALLY